MIDFGQPSSPVPPAAESKARAHEAAQAALNRWRSRPHTTDQGTIIGRTQPPTCTGCGGTLAQDEHDRHPGCTPTDQEAP